MDDLEILLTALKSTDTTWNELLENILNDIEKNSRTSENNSAGNGCPKT